MLAKSFTASASFIPIYKVSMFSFIAPSCKSAANVFANSFASGLPMAPMAAFSSSHFLLWEEGRISG